MYSISLCSYILDNHICTSISQSFRVGIFCLWLYLVTTLVFQHLSNHSAETCFLVFQKGKRGINYIDKTKKHVSLQMDDRTNFVPLFSQELGLGPSVPVHVVLQDWIRHSDGKLSFLGFVRLLHGVSSRSFQKAWIWTRLHTVIFLLLHTFVGLKCSKGAICKPNSKSCRIRASVPSKYRSCWNHRQHVLISFFFFPNLYKPFYFLFFLVKWLVLLKF